MMSSRVGAISKLSSKEYQNEFCGVITLQCKVQNDKLTYIIKGI